MILLKVRILTSLKCIQVKGNCIVAIFVGLAPTPSLDLNLNSDFNLSLCVCVYAC